MIKSARAHAERGDAPTGANSDSLRKVEAVTVAFPNSKTWKEAVPLNEQTATASTSA
jgi:hypothetical protein